MMISVAICTWNRSAVLAKCLEQIAACRPPESGRWEVVVVNNNSSDDTDAVLESFSGRLPLKRVWEPRPGVSNARNAAVAVVSGDCILWTDDDVRVSENWIVEYERAFAEHPDVVFFGGPIRAHFDEEPPEWFRRCMNYFPSAFALRDFGPDAVELDVRTVPFGANWAVRTAQQREFRFDPRLGRQPADPTLGGEEIQVMEELLARGHRARWVPNAPVGHLVGRERQSMAYIKRYYRGIGRTQSITDPVSGWALFGFRSPWLIRQALQACWRYQVLRWTKDEAQWAPMLLHSSILLGRAFCRGVPPSSR